MPRVVEENVIFSCILKRQILCDSTCSNCYVICDSYVLLPSFLYSICTLCLFDRSFDIKTFEHTVGAIFDLIDRLILKTFQHFDFYVY